MRKVQNIVGEQVFNAPVHLRSKLLVVSHCMIQHRQYNRHSWMSTNQKRANGRPASLSFGNTFFARVDINKNCILHGKGEHNDWTSIQAYRTCLILSLPTRLSASLSCVSVALSNACLAHTWLHSSTLVPSDDVIVFWATIHSFQIVQMPSHRCLDLYSNHDPLS